MSDDQFSVVKSRKGMEARNNIMRAAIELAGEKGIESLNVNQLTQHANMGRASFYNYFDSIDVLIDAIIQQVSEEIQTSLEEIHGLSDRGVPRLTKCLKLLLERSYNDSDWGRFAAKLFNYSNFARNKLKSVVKLEIEAGIKTGELHLKDSEVEAYIEILTAGLISALSRLSNREAKKGEIEKFIQIMLRAAKS